MQIKIQNEQLYYVQQNGNNLEASNKRRFPHDAIRNRIYVVMQLAGDKARHSANSAPLMATLDDENAPFMIIAVFHDHINVRHAVSAVGIFIDIAALSYGPFEASYIVIQYPFGLQFRQTFSWYVLGSDGPKPFFCLKCFHYLLFTYQRV